MNTQILARKIFDVFTPFLRTHTSKKTCMHEKSMACFSYHLNKIEHLVSQHKKITFILPAFPAKSPNTEKTQTHLPDLGEALSLQFLNSLCEEIYAFYAPGANIIICSDGRVFNDLVKVNDDHVSAYSNAIKTFIHTDNLKNITTYDLNDHYNSLSHADIREKLLTEYAETILSLKDKIKNEFQSTLLFNGMHRFVYEDYCNLFDTFSKNKLKKLSKAVTYQLMQRSNAWSQLLLKKFPEAIRLSIHPQDCQSEKLGIMLLNADNTWATPWHRVVLKNKNNYSLIRKKEAESLGAVPVYEKNHFSHYLLLENT